MKLVKNYHQFQLCLILLIITISLVSSKLRMKHKKQIVLGRPSSGTTVVSPLVEADERPSHSVINIPISPKPNLYSVQVAPVVHSSLTGPLGVSSVSTLSSPYRPNINNLNSLNSYTSSNLNNFDNASQVVNHVNVYPDQDLTSIIHEANFHLTQGNMERSLDLYADALARVNPSQETKVLSHIVNNLNKVHNDLARKLENKLGNIKPALATKIRNLMLNLSQTNIKQNGMTNQVHSFNDINDINDNAHSLESHLPPINQEIGDSLVSKPKPKSENDDALDQDIGDSLVSKPKPFSDDEEIISLEPKKKILRLGKLDENSNHDENSNNSSSVHKNDKRLLAGLIDWAKQNRIQLKKLKVNSNSKLSGESNIKAGEKLKKNEMILSIPKDFLISKENPALKDLCEQLKKIKFFKRNYDKICMTVFLIKKAQDPKFKSFVEFIHDNTIFSSFPFFFNKKEAKMIEGSYFSSLVSGREEAMNFEFKVLKEDKILADTVTKKDYYQARINVMSKNFSLKDAEGHYISFLAPFTDLLNHNSVKANARLDLNQDKLEIKAINTIKKNEAIFTTYGKFSNFHYLLYYGFVEQHNPVSVRINLELKIKNGQTGKNNQEVMLYPDMNIDSTLKTFRKVVDKFSNKKISSDEKKKPIDIINEIEALRLLKVGLKKQISKYHTTLAQDKEQLKILTSSNKSRNLVNILTVLIEEKKIIVRYYNTALVFYKMLKRANERGESQVMTLTKKVSDMIQKKKYMREYFDLISKVFKLKIEFNKDEKSEEMDLDLSDLQSESEDDYEREMKNFESLASEEYEGNDYSYGLTSDSSYPHQDFNQLNSAPSYINTNNQHENTGNNFYNNHNNIEYESNFLNHHTNNQAPSNLSHNY
jgi:hypothetical protein